MGDRAAIDTRRVKAGLTRLARDGKVRPSKGDHILFKIPVVSKTGKKCSVTVLLDASHREQHESVLELIADSLHVPRDQLGKVLDTWTPEKYAERCRALTDDELKPPSMRRRF